MRYQPFELAIGEERDGRAVVVRVGGELDLASSPRLRQVLRALVEHGPDEVVVDLSHTDFIDASGLGALALAQSLLTARHGRLVLRSPTRPVGRVLEMTGLEHLITTGEDEASAA